MDRRLGHVALTQHPLGAQLGTVRHMCPEPGCRQADGTPSPFCPVCLGAGDISADRLDRWQSAQYRQVS